MVRIWAFALGALHVPIYSVPLPSMALAFIWILSFFFARRFSPYWWVLLCFVSGCLVANWRIQKLCDAQLAVELDHSLQVVTFHIDSLVSQNPDFAVFTAQILAIECQRPSCQRMQGRHVRLAWYYPGQTVEAGQVWLAEVKLKRPRGLANPGGFDYQAWLLSQGVSASGYVHGAAHRQAQQPVWANTRQSVLRSLQSQSQNNTYQRFWPALVVGDRSAITASDWQVLQATGTVHLVAISGLHIGLVAAGLFVFGSLLARGLVLLQSGSGVAIYRWVPALLSSVGALYYAALAGFSIPTLRAVCACLILHLCRIMGWNIAALTLLGIGVAVVVITEPLAIVNQGFWLSFLAVLCLLFCFSGRLDLSRRWGWIRMQWVLSLGLLVPLLLVGQGVSLVSPLANIVAVPVISLLVVPGLLLAALCASLAPGMSVFLLHWVDQVFALLWAFLHWLGGQSWALWWPDQAQRPTSMVLAGIAVMVLLMPRYLRLWGLGAVLFATAFAVSPRPINDAVVLTVMDVGQGLALVLQAQGETMVYDTGPAFSGELDAGSRILVPYLRRQSADTVDLVVSHDDLDHSGGSISLLRLLAVRSLRVGEPLSALVGQKEQQLAEPCVSGDRWRVGTVTAEVLWPPAEVKLEGNQASCVLQLSFAHQGKMVKIWLTGDIDAEVEQQLMAKLGGTVDVMIAPHHGSNSSSSYGFVRRASPAIVVFSAGYKNAYHHPHPTVQRRYAWENSQSFNTAEQGAMVFTWNKEGLTVSRTRQVEHKRWYDE